MKAVLALPLFFALAAAQANLETCWEQCFRVADTDDERFQPIYDEFYRMGMEARRLKNYHTTNGTSFLLDSNLDDYHNETLNDNFLPTDEIGDNIFMFQRRLASIVNYMIGSDAEYNPAFIAQFDRNDAWTCNGHGCLDACQFDEVIFNEMEDVKMTNKSHFDGNTEAACSLSYWSIRATSDNNGPLRSDNLWECHFDARNEMVIVFANSDIHHRVRRYHEGSPCREHYNNRMVVGTHAASWSNMNSFSSDDAHSIFIEDNPYTMEAAETLQLCMQQSCCSGTVSDPNASCECVITNDRYGDTREDYNDHEHQECFEGA